MFSPDLVRADFYLNGLWHDFSLISALGGAEDDLRALIGGAKGSTQSP